LKKIRISIYSITGFLVIWSIYCIKQMQGLNIFNLSVNKGNFIVATYKYVYVTTVLFFVTTAIFLFKDIRTLKSNIKGKIEKNKADKIQKKLEKETLKTTLKINERTDESVSNSKLNETVSTAAEVIQLEEEKPIVTCNKCGFNNKPTNKFCEKCGNKLLVEVGELNDI